jgi:cytoskeletal protein CcmA (bactofilin family)
MFRKRKDEDHETAGNPDGGRFTDAPKPSVAKGLAPKGLPAAPRLGSGNGGVPADVGNRSLQNPATRGRAGNPALPSSNARKLIVGQDIRLKGEVTSCDAIVVEGQIELSRSEARQIQVAPTGVFLGEIEVEEADVSGRFEGGLVARERLFVRSTGSISGRIRYGKIIVESGGTIIGEVMSLDEQEPATVPAVEGPAAARGASVSKPAGEKTDEPRREKIVAAEER